MLGLLASSLLCFKSAYRNLSLISLLVDYQLSFSNKLTCKVSYIEASKEVHWKVDSSRDSSWTRQFYHSVEWEENGNKRWTKGGNGGLFDMQCVYNYCESSAGLKIRNLTKHNISLGLYSASVEAVLKLHTRGYQVLQNINDWFCQMWNRRARINGTSYFIAQGMIIDRREFVVQLLLDSSKVH